MSKGSNKQEAVKKARKRLFYFSYGHAQIINLLRELPITMLVSTHDMVLVKELFPRTIVMDDGQIVADGLTMEILADEALLNAHGLEKP